MTHYKMFKSGEDFKLLSLLFNNDTHKFRKEIVLKAMHTRKDQVESKHGPGSYPFTLNYQNRSINCNLKKLREFGGKWVAFLRGSDLERWHAIPSVKNLI